MKYLLILFFVFTSAQACEREVYPYVRIAAGWTGNFNGERLDNEGDLAAQIELGLHFPLNDNWLIDAKYGHDSWWFEGNDGDEARDHINFGLEYQFK